MSGRPGPFVILALAGAFAAGCGGEQDGRCLALPCPLPVAVTLRITAATGGPVDGALVIVSGATNGSVHCTVESGRTTCRIPGTAGVYVVDVSAPGFTRVSRTVNVPGTNPECGCPTVDTQELELVLTPASATASDGG